MNENYDKLKILLNQYSNGAITENEAHELFGLLNNNPEIDIEPLLTEILEGTEPQPDASRRERLMEKLFTPAIEEDRRMTRVRKIFSLRWVAAAAAILILLFSGYFLLNDKPGKNDEMAGTTGNTKDVAAPKGTKAKITLANGQTVLLDSITSGMIAQQGDVNVVKTDDGQIIYKGTSTAVVYNTLFNPRGSEVISLSLSDGTKIWLNSESSIKYPVAFTGNERGVEITGEAYFEVAKDATKKFIVTGNNVVTEVLGTHFNVNAYADETDIKVTLLEGAVKVSKGHLTGMLKPGQQAQVNAEVKITSDVDVDVVMAWKNGFFSFNKADIKTVMGQISRWYGVDVSYESGAPNEHFGGEMERSLTLFQVLKGLEKSNVHFRLEENKIIVLP